MPLSESEAIITLCIQMGAADGEFSEIEMQSLVKNPVFMKYEWDSDLYGEKIDKGEATRKNAIATLKESSSDTQIDALALVWHVLLADGEMGEDEKTIMAELLIEFNVDIETVNNRFKEQFN